MARNRVGRSFRGGRKLRAVDWALSLQNDGFTNIAATASADFGGALSLGLISNEPFTIVRTRGVFTVVTDQLAAGPEDQVATLGVSIVTLRAAAAGIAVTALPRPFTDPLADWFVYEKSVNRFLFGDATGFQSIAGERIVVDSKAQRRIDQPTEQSLVAIVENAGQTAGINVAVHLRFLIKFT